MEPAEFVIVGGGWRAAFFLLAARELPKQFAVRGICTRDPAKRQRLTATWGIPAYATLAEMLSSTRPLFAVVSLPCAVATGVLEELTRHGVPTLTETPPAADVEGLTTVNALTARGGRIQVAEQYLFQPFHAARIAVAQSGLLGTISQAQVSFTHSYHGISLMRHFLGVGFDSVKITARRFESPVIKGPDRAGAPLEEKFVPIKQTIAWFDFGDRLGVFDFATDQHRSYVRSDRILLRGERGEINQTRVRHVMDFRTPMEFELQRLDAGENGNLEGFHHKGIVGGDRWWYENPFGSARLADDEIAVATCLARMAEYARGGKDFYSLAEASHDQYLSLMMEQAIAAGESVQAHARAWARW
jgi:predicted dehydrogenase